MSTFVYMTRCDGCGHCVDICPSDIMHIDETIRRAKNIEPNFCWECYSCVKACPNHAIDGIKSTSTNSIYLKGARLGHGNALCIVQPGTLKEVVKCLQLIVDAGCVVLPQGSNTGLTGG